MGGVYGKHAEYSVQFRGACFGCQVAQLVGGVERIRFGHRPDVNAGLFEFGDAVDGLVKPARMIQRNAYAHQRHVPPGQWLTAVGPCYFSSVTIFCSGVTNGASGSTGTV